MMSQLGEASVGKTIALFSPKFWAVEKLSKNSNQSLICSKSFLPRCEILGMKIPQFEKIRAELKF